MSERLEQHYINQWLEQIAQEYGFTTKENYIIDQDQLILRDIILKRKNTKYKFTHITVERKHTWFGDIANPKFEENLRKWMKTIKTTT